MPFIELVTVKLKAEFSMVVNYAAILIQTPYKLVAFVNYADNYAFVILFDVTTPNIEKLVTVCESVALIFTFSNLFIYYANEAVYYYFDDLNVGYKFTMVFYH